MKDFRIFTESKADVKFLRDYVAAVFQIDLSRNHFDTLGSWSGYKAGGVLNTSIRENHDNNKMSVLILDADKDFNARKAEVLRDFVGYDIPVNLFLFPNNAESGNIETLLAEIARDRKLMECFLEYEKCVTGYTKPLNDARIYSYLNMLLHPNQKNETGIDLRREEFRDYKNKSHWNLHHEYLNPLKQFLQSLLVLK